MAVAVRTTPWASMLIPPTAPWLLKPKPAIADNPAQLAQIAMPVTNLENTIKPRIVTRSDIGITPQTFYWAQAFTGHKRQKPTTLNTNHAVHALQQKA